MWNWAMIVACAVTVGCGREATIYSPSHVDNIIAKRSQNLVLQGALRQFKVPPTYDGCYVSLSYPGGDVATNRGACADVVVRALRFAGYDLQQLIHEDARLRAYPRIKVADTNIDHRRVLNQEVYFSRHGQVLSVRFDQEHLSQWNPGDIVSWRLLGGKTHIGIVSDRKRSDGVPFVIHNMGGLKEEDALQAWPIYGHYRFPKR